MTAPDGTIATVGDVGAIFKIGVIDVDGAQKDISDALQKEFRVRKPDQSAVVWPAEFVSNGANGLLIYTTVADDLDQAGTWLLETRIVTATADWRTITQTQFRIKGPL